MSVQNLFSVQSPVPKAIGCCVCFVTIGVGVLRSVEPFEIGIRSVVAGVVSWLLVKILTQVWHRMSEDALHMEQNND